MSWTASDDAAAEADRIITDKRHAETTAAIALVVAERDRQQALKFTGKFVYTCADAAMSDADALAVLVEEVGEVAKEINETIGRFLGAAQYGEYRERLRAELVQVAAVAVAWVEKLGKELP